MTDKNKQSGFGTLIIVTIVAVALVLAGISYVVLRGDDKNTNGSTQTTTQATPTPTMSPSPATPATPEIVANEFKISELGIEFTVSESLKDVKYIVRDVTLPNGIKVKRAYITTKEVEAAATNCSVAENPMGILTVADGQYPKDDADAYLNYGQLFKQLPNKFITLAMPHDSCSSPNSAASKLYSDSQSALRSSIDTVKIVE